MRFIHILVALCGVTLIGGFAACSGDDDDDATNPDDGGGDLCVRLCPLAVEEECVEDADTCVDDCHGLMALLPDGCESELDDYADCIAEASDLECSTLTVLSSASCQNELDAVFSCGETSDEGGGGAGGANTTAGGATGEAGTPTANGGVAGSSGAGGSSPTAGGATGEAGTPPADGGAAGSN